MILEVFTPYGILLACMFWRWWWWCSHFVWCRFLQSLHLRNHSGRVVNTSNGWAKWPHPSHKEHPSPAWVWPCVAQKAWNISHHISLQAWLRYVALCCVRIWLWLICVRATGDMLIPSTVHPQRRSKYIRVSPGSRWCVPLSLQPMICVCDSFINSFTIIYIYNFIYMHHHASIHSSSSSSSSSATCIF